MKPSVTSKELKQALNIAKELREKIGEENCNAHNMWHQHQGSDLEIMYRAIFYATSDCVLACNIIDAKLTNFDEEDWEELWNAYTETKASRPNTHEQMRVIFKQAGIF